MGLLNAIGLDTVFGEVGKTIRQVLPNEEAERTFDLEWEKLQQQTEQRVHEQVLAQVELNKVEAKSESTFVSGWRPMIGWVCAIALGYNFLLAPLLAGFVPGLRMLELEGLIGLIFTMLGVSGTRTYEKLKGVSGTQPPVQPVVQVKDDAQLTINAETKVPNEEENAPWTR